MRPLSRKQMQIYEYIESYIRSEGYPPSLREIGAAVNLSSPSTVHSHLNALERAELITRSSGKTRSIALTNAPEVSGGVPILGSVAAGEPILAVEDALGYLPYIVDDSDEYFALKIRGDSMIDAGILNGDMVVVRRQPFARSGEIVIAMLDDEATCKTLRLRDGETWLMPENDDYDPIPGEYAAILGKVTAVIRTY